MWSPDGKELFMVPGPGQFAVTSEKSSPAFEFTPLAVVPRRFGIAPPANPRPYDILPDGRIVSIDASAAADGQSSQLRVVLNWFEELKSKLPASK